MLTFYYPMATIILDQSSDQVKKNYFVHDSEKLYIWFSILVYVEMGSTKKVPHVLR